MVVKRIGKILLGCFTIIVILTILGAIFAGTIVKKIITGAIKEKTGVQVNIDNSKKGNLTYTDPKTGQTLNIGGNKIPDNFPKDFPIYEGSSVTSSLAGDKNKEGSSGFWLTLTTNDKKDKVISFYNENLIKNGWKTQNTQETGENTNLAVTKNNLSGYITIAAVNNQTSILIILGEVTPTSQ